jgi:hypothetical protein
MPAELHWLAVGAFSTAFTFAWLFAGERITVTTLFATAGWSWMSVTGGDLTRYTEGGTEIAISSTSLQYLTVALALLSLLALLMHQFGHYPPDDDSPVPSNVAD